MPCQQDPPGRLCLPLSLFLLPAGGSGDGEAPVCGQAWTSSGTDGACPGAGRAEPDQCRGWVSPGRALPPPPRPGDVTRHTHDVTTTRALPALNFKPVAAPNRLCPRAGPALPSVTAPRQWDGSAPCAPGQLAASIPLADASFRPPAPRSPPMGEGSAGSGRGGRCAAANGSPR